MRDVVITGGALISEEVGKNATDFVFPVIRLSDVDYDEMIGGRGLRYLTDATKMALITANKAKENAGIEDIDSERSGIVVATNFSSISTIVDFDKTTITEGPRAVGAMQSPNLVLNATAAKLGIHFDITGFNTTVSSGRVGTFDAIDYACNMIQNDEVDMVMVTGVEEMKKQLRDWFFDTKNFTEDKLSMLRQFCGTIILESEEHAKERNAKIYGKIKGSCSSINCNYLVNGGTDEDDLEEYDYLTESLAKDEEDIWNICLSDDRFDGKDKYEAEYMNGRFPKAKVVSVREMFGGEKFGATGAAQILYSLNSFDEGKGLVFCNDWTGNFRALLLEK